MRSDGCMITEKTVKLLIKNVKRLSKEVKELTEVLQKQNDWLAELAGIINGEDEELEKESEEWKEHLNPVNALSGRSHKGDRRRHNDSFK
jgi:hypothetical protein